MELIRSVTGGGEFSNAYHLLALREERHERKNIQDDVNNSKLKELVEDLNGTDRCIIIITKNTGAWLNVGDTTVAGTVLVAPDFYDFYAHVMMLLSLNFREIMTAVPHPLVQVTDLVEANESSSFQVTTNCVKNFSTSIGKPSLLPVYKAKPSSTRTAAD